MCGIGGYIGYRENGRQILAGILERLEYRGYDSAGIAVANEDGTVTVYKTIEKVAMLKKNIGDDPPASSRGLAHTRWATQGEPTLVNAHPHTDEAEEIFVVHNGVIENFDFLHDRLTTSGHTFRSETDSEIIPHLIEEQPDTDPPEERVKKALQQIVGTYGVIVMFKSHPDILIVARNGSPVLIGVGEHEHIIASDATGVIDYTRSVIYLKDGQMAVVSRDAYRVFDMKHDGEPLEEVNPEISQITWSIDQIKRQGYAHHMLFEIHQQPRTIMNGMRGRVGPDRIILGGISEYLDQLLNAPLIGLTGCGTSWHAALIGEMLLEEMAGIPAEVKYASELAHLKRPAFPKGTVLFSLTQSGETADTREAAKKAMEMGYLVLGIVNSVGSTIAREVPGGIYIHAGPEIGVASTKAFTSQVLTLTMLSFMLGTMNNFIQHNFKPNWSERFLNEMLSLPAKVEAILHSSEYIQGIAEVYAKHRNFLYLGRGINFPSALEGALKLKEISYIHAEGYPAAEMKHGPIALVDRNMPTVVVALDTDHAYDKVLVNMAEIKTRKGVLIAVAHEGDERIKKLASHVLTIPRTSYLLTPLLVAIPLQLLAYHIAALRGCKIDQPRNLAKSVTVG